MLGKILSNQVKNARIESLHDAEFSVYSQWGDDGIIQYLVNNIEISDESFVEFGIQNYREANTRFLLINNNWRGLIMDSSKKYIDQVKGEAIYWKFDLTARSAFVTRENINQLIQDAGFHGKIGLLHIDIDGNDYWVWKALSVVDPDIVVVEYNSIFENERAITIPYKPFFNRTKAHYSNLYFGASLLALCDLADERGYHFVGCNSNGNNAYFIKKDKVGKIKPQNPNTGYVYSRFREARNSKGELVYMGGEDRRKIIKGLEVYNTRTNRMETL
jgi:hypothetical protein